MDKEYDVIVLGKGLKECILSGLLTSQWMVSRTQEQGNIHVRTQEPIVHSRTQDPIIDNDLILDDDVLLSSLTSKKRKDGETSIVRGNLKSLEASDSSTGERHKTTYVIQHNLLLPSFLEPQALQIKSNLSYELSFRAKKFEDWFILCVKKDHEKFTKSSDQ
ncbi:hypothetical protein ACE6H2_020917 [Prunus campanulata]